MFSEEINGEIVERKYTPVSTVDQLGTFDLLIKIYRPCEQFPKGGKLTSWMEHLVVIIDELYIFSLIKLFILQAHMVD